MNHCAGLCVLITMTMAPRFGRAQDAKTPDALEIIKKSVARNSLDWRAQPEYSYREHDSKSKVNSSGDVKAEQSKTYEVTMIDGSPYNRLIAINNERLPPAQEQQEQSKLSRETKRREHESPAERQARIAKYQNERSEEHVLMQQMVSAFNFRLTGEEQLNGLECYVFDALPNPSYHAPVDKAKVLKGMKGRLWIEKSEYHWAKVDAEVTQPVEFGLFLARVKPGTEFELDQAAVGNVWLPKRFVESINATVLGLYGMRNTEEENYSDYRQTTLAADRRGPKK